jgi:hypothetical protein
MSKGTIKPARDIARMKACERIAKKYKRSMDWAYKVSRRDRLVQDGEYYKQALEDYCLEYDELKKILN